MYCNLVNSGFTPDVAYHIRVTGSLASITPLLQKRLESHFTHGHICALEHGVDSAESSFILFIHLFVSDTMVHSKKRTNRQTDRQTHKQKREKDIVVLFIFV